MTGSRAQIRRPLARRVQARAFRAINVPMRVVLGLPFPTPAGRRLMLLYLTAAGPAGAIASPSATSAMATRS